MVCVAVCVILTATVLDVWGEGCLFWHHHCELPKSEMFTSQQLSVKLGVKSGSNPVFWTSNIFDIFQSNENVLCGF